MNFLNPFLLFGLAAAALPILIHLFTRRRPREMSFPSLEFLTEVHHSEIRRLKLKQWLLLLLRTLAVMMVVLAMARPALRGSLGPHRNASTTVVALVDVSGSMGAWGRAGAGGHDASLEETARGVVSDLMSTLAASDELLLVPYDLEPHPLSDGPSSDLARLRSALRTLAPGAGATEHCACAGLRGARAGGIARAQSRAVLDLGLPGHRLRERGRPAAAGWAVGSRARLSGPDHAAHARERRAHRCRAFAHRDRHGAGGRGRVVRAAGGRSLGDGA